MLSIEKKREKISRKQNYEMYSKTIINGILIRFKLF